MNLNISFRNEFQERFFWHLERNGMADGGFNNGKSFVGCQRAIVHLGTFSNYGLVIARQTYKVLRSTTMKTFFKLCPNELIYRHSEQDGYTVLRNRSFIYWMHLDDVDEQDLRGLEINSVLLDQAEEIGEGIYLIMDARVGRWDKAQVPLWLLRQKLSAMNLELSMKIEKDQPRELSKFIIENSLWPKHPKWGHFLVPNYMDCLCNPSDEDEFHWNYRYYNPLSLERKKNHFYCHAASDRDLTDSQTYDQMLTRDKEWVDKYVHGITGSPKSAIHNVRPISVIDPDINPAEFNAFFESLKKRGGIYRILDHADTGVTAVCWVAVLNKCHIFFWEMYEEALLISESRQMIHDLTGDMDIMDDFADPAIFKKDRQRVDGMQAGFWSVADEYNDTEIYTAPPILWAPADNNEIATRNRINELLKPSQAYFHPITKETPAPAIYFIKQTPSFPYGCDQLIVQTKQQRKLLVAETNGKKIYSIERDPKIVDHAYDLVRYHISQHLEGKKPEPKHIPERSFAGYAKAAKLRAMRIYSSAMDE